MPELPEVEITARNLRSWAVGRRIERAEAEPTARYVFRPSTPARFAREVAGHRFESVTRTGKQLLITLDGEREPLGLLAHLGMTGKWLLRRAGEPGPPLVKARFFLDDGHVLHYRDPRLFGRLRLVPGARFDALREVRELGPDPLVTGIELPWLAERLARIGRPIKVALMDQRLLPGVGNILASEALFRARIDPRRPARDLTRAELKRVAAGVLDSVNATIEREQGPEIEYVEEPGSSNPFLVYDREGEPCPRCGKGRIVRLVQDQRSTYYCPRCQR